MTETTLTLSADGPNSVPLLQAALSGLAFEELPIESLQVALGLSEPPSGVTIEVEGENAVAEARRHLNVYSHEEQELTTFSVTAELDGDTFDPGLHLETDGSEQTLSVVERVNDNRSGSSIPPDVPGRIVENTLYHLVLYRIRNANQRTGQWLPPEELHQGHAFGLEQARNVLSKLFRDKALVDRQKQYYESSDMQIYHYWVNDAGQDELDRLGEPDVEKVFGEADKSQGQVHAPTRHSESEESSG